MEVYFPSMILIFESIRSLHLQTMGEEHQLQHFAKQNVEILDSDETQVAGSFKKNLEETIDIDEDL
jgi:translation initiation factor 2 beta subunit (eIF-2beta)/eIF-5